MEVTTVHFDRVTAEVTALTYCMVQTTSKELYKAIMYNTVYGKVAAK